MLKKYGRYFEGHEISKYGLEHNRVDYATFCKAFDLVPCSDIILETYHWNWEQKSGFVDYSKKIEELQNKLETTEDDSKRERIEAMIDHLEDEADYIFDSFKQYFVVSAKGAYMLDEINEAVFYNPTFDLYVWGVRFKKKKWDCILTSIPCNEEEANDAGYGRSGMDIEEVVRRLDAEYDEMVPPMGDAETVAGNLVLCIHRILEGAVDYQDYVNKDYISEDLSGEVHYIENFGGKESVKEIRRLLDRRYTNYDAYYNQVIRVAEAILRDIYDNNLKEVAITDEISHFYDYYDSDDEDGKYNW